MVDVFDELCLEEATWKDDDATAEWHRCERENIFKYMCLVTCRDKDIPKRQLLLKVLKVFLSSLQGMRHSSLEGRGCDDVMPFWIKIFCER